jgi:hypothetical protein
MRSLQRPVKAQFAKPQMRKGRQMLPRPNLEFRKSYA